MNYEKFIGWLTGEDRFYQCIRDYSHDSRSLYFRGGNTRCLDEPILYKITEETFQRIREEVEKTKAYIDEQHAIYMQQLKRYEDEFKESQR